MTFWVAGAVVTSAVIGSQAAKKGSQAQLQAADAQAAAQLQSTQDQIAAQERAMAEQTRLQEPFRQAGITGQNELMRLLGLGQGAGTAGYGSMAQPFTNQDMYKDPGYAFRVSEGVKALDRSAAARGGLLGGNQLRGVTELGQNLGSQEYQNAFNRYQTERAARLNPLQSLAGQGQSAANTLSGAAGAMGSNVAGIYGNLGSNLSNIAGNVGNIRSSGYINQANALTGALGQGVNYFTNQQMMNRVFGSQNPYGSNVPIEERSTGFGMGG